MASSGRVGRELRATYAFAGATVSLDRTVPLESGEAVLTHGAMRLRSGRLLPRAAVVRLTDRRLSVLAHYAFRPGRVWHLPRGSVQNVETGKGVLRTRRRGKAGPAVLALAGWTCRSALDRSWRGPDAVAELLLDWLNS